MMATKATILNRLHNHRWLLRLHLEQPVDGPSWDTILLLSWLLVVLILDASDDTDPWDSSNLEAF